GYAVQTAFIGAGAVVGSLFPWLLDHIGVANQAGPGQIPDTVRYSFWAGGAALLGAVLWTVFTTQEYAPETMAGFGEAAEGEAADPGHLAQRSPAAGLPWIAAGGVIALAVRAFGLEKEVYLLAALLAAYGIASVAAVLLARGGKSQSMLASIVGDFSGMPPLMKRLALVQFFSWSALFIMWINTTPVVAQYFYGATDPASAAYQEAGNWVGVLFSVYNGVAAIAALLVLPRLSARIGKVRTHALCLIAGALGYAGFFVAGSANALVFCEIGVGLAWASILAMPYAILASSLPQAKLGIYMGLFNVFIVVPQLLVATVMGSIMKAFFPGQPIWTMAFAAGTLVLAALAMTRVQVPGEA
ncbi:MAG: MFS transporter, partial [Sphingomonadales bacterium]|nr:MFS transporter [Sphingomonadales bacterium]